MSKFFGASLFKKSSASSVGGDHVQQSIANHDSNKNLKSFSTSSSVMWDTICDLNSSSDLDESSDFFYSRPNIFSPNIEKSNSPYTAPSEKSTAVKASSSNANKWKTNFMLPESTAKKSRAHAPKVDSPSLPRLLTKSQNSPSLGLRYASKLNKSPAIKSPSSTLESEFHDGEEPNLCVELKNSPKAILLDGSDTSQKRNLFSELETSFELSSVDIDDNVEEENENTNQHYHSKDDKNEMLLKSKHESALQEDDQTDKAFPNGTDK
ncbi:hypothetical protein Aperf_G00000126484 [Anoplocephala perfoliata]